MVVARIPRPRSRSRYAPRNLQSGRREPGGCFTCRYFGERVDVAVWCGRPDSATFARKLSAAAHFGSVSRAPTCQSRRTDALPRCYSVRSDGAPEPI
jgi:hypothetical protein